MGEILQFKTKDDRITEKCEWMLDHPDEVDWNEFADGLMGWTDGGKYKDIVESMPTPEEIQEMAEGSREHAAMYFNEIVKRSEEKGPRIIKEPETMEEAINMSDEDFFEYLKQEEIRERHKHKNPGGGRA